MEAMYEESAAERPDGPGPGASDVAGRDGRLRAAISDSVVAAMKEVYGKGPTKVKTYLIEDGAVVVIDQGLTTVERTLVDRGRGDLVRDVRESVHEHVAARLDAEIEAITGKSVLASQTELVFDPEREVKVFFLAP
jgi:uncharacterized protein YbcI